MKKITKNTILKCEDKIYYPIEIDSNIYWVDKSYKIEDKNTPYFTFNCKTKIGEYGISKDYRYVNKYPLDSFKIFAQSSPKLENISVINLDNYIEHLAYLFGSPDSSQWYDWKEGFIEGYKSNINQYTQIDIVKAIELAQTTDEEFNFSTTEKIIEQINSISIIEVNENFKIVSYN